MLNRVLSLRTAKKAAAFISTAKLKAASCGPPVPHCAENCRSNPRRDEPRQATKMAKAAIYLKEQEGIEPDARDYQIVGKAVVGRLLTG